MAINYRDYTWENLPSTSTPTSAANFNAMEAGIKAACDELDARPVVRAAALTSDFTGTQENTTLEDVTGLAIAVAADEIVTFEAVIFVSSGLTPDAKIGLTCPAGATIGWGASTLGVSADIHFGTITRITSGASVDVRGDADAGEYTAVKISGRLINSTTAGTLQVQVAQNTSDASATNVLAGSIIRAEIWT